jgi:hypothetical protein
MANTNECEQLDGVVRITLKSRDKEVEYITLADEADYPLVKEYRWVANKLRRNRCEDRVYAYAHIPDDNGKVKLIAMHTLLLRGKIQLGQIVVHRNGERLDNRRANLKACYRGEAAELLEVHMRDPIRGRLLPSRRMDCATLQTSKAS